MLQNEDTCIIYIFKNLRVKQVLHLPSLEKSMKCKICFQLNSLYMMNHLYPMNENFRAQTELLQIAKGQLNRLTVMDSIVSSTAKFTALYISVQLLLTQILERGLWMNPSSSVTQQTNNFKSHIQELLHDCLKLQYLFVGLSPVERYAVKQFRLKALALNLVYIVKGIVLFIS